MAARITDLERRARLVERHRLNRAPGTLEGVVEGLVALHSSDPASPYLAAWARLAGFHSRDLEAALYERRSLWRLHAMRRTLFVVGRADAPVFDGAAGREVARKERARRTPR